MRIIQVIPYLGLAGAEVMCTSLAIEEKKLGNDILVVSLYDYQSSLSEKLEKNDIKVIYLNKSKGFDLKMIPQLSHIFKKYNPDVVHSHLDTLKYVAIAATFSRIKVKIHTVHNVAQKEAQGLAMKINNYAYHNLGVVPVALSEEVKQTINVYYRLEANEIPVIFNGVDLTQCNKKNCYDLKEDTLQIINVARFSMQKNQEILVEAVSELLKQGYKMHLRFVGDGDRLDLIQEKVRRVNLENVVEFCGKQDNVHPFLESSDVFILPSHYEGMPMSVIEAMGTGLPVVATNVGGLPTMIKDKVNGILIKDNLDELINAIKLMYDGKLREQFGKNAYTTANESFSAKKMTESYLDLYNERNNMEK